jgi:hypothetical protein
LDANTAHVPITVPSKYRYPRVPSNTKSKSCHPGLKLAHVIDDTTLLYHLPESYIAKPILPLLDSKFHHPLSVQEIALP